MIKIKQAANEICSTKCFGIDGYDGSCCSIENRDYIIGPINDADEFIAKLSKKLGREVKKSDIFIEFDEGSKLFPKLKNWQNPTAYPAFRVDLESTKKSCIFYNRTTKSCGVYEIRPVTCRLFKCDYLRQNS